MFSKNFFLIGTPVRLRNVMLNEASDKKMLSGPAADLDAENNTKIK